MNAQEIADDILDFQCEQMRENIIGIMLGHGICPEAIAAHMLQINSVLAQVRQAQASAVLSQVMLTQTLSKTNGGKSHG